MARINAERKWHGPHARCMTVCDFSAWRGEFCLLAERTRCAASPASTYVRRAIRWRSRPPLTRCIPEPVRPTRKRRAAALAARRSAGVPRLPGRQAGRPVGGTSLQRRSRLPTPWSIEAGGSCTAHGALEAPVRE